MLNNPSGNLGAGASSAPSDPARRPARPISSSFKYYIHDGSDTCRLQLIGELSEAEVTELNGCWRTAKTTLTGRKLVLDLKGLRAVDDAGRQWLAAMASEGASYEPEFYLRDALAGRNKIGSVPTRPAEKQSLVSRVIGIFRGSRIAATE